MSDVAIRVENLGKRYRIGGRQERYKRFTETVMDTLTAPIHRLRNLGKPVPPEENLWALKDVSLEIKRGEAVGIIGRNGAGKSTLLKILSRITEPTTGRVELHGRVGSLLEVGTGFHPELTGRENIYLNGAILGMRRAEIDRKFDEIVAFAEIEKFLDTPVKRYSSGMYVRLAFAVAAHLEPEILLVDEVLAVGDAEFQKKCLGKMGEVAGEGRTVLFVSHNMNAITSLCQQAVLLHRGRLLSSGNVADVTKAYLTFGSAQESQTIYVCQSRKDLPHFRRVHAMQGGQQEGPFSVDQEIQLRMQIETCGQRDLVASVQIRNSSGMCLHHSSDEFATDPPVIGDDGFRSCIVPPYGVGPGRYWVDLYLGKRNYELFESVIGAVTFEIEFAGAVSDRTHASQWKGLCGPGLLKWSCQERGDSL